MPRIDDNTDSGMFFTNNTQWLEEIDDRRCISPEALLTSLEGMLDTGEYTTEDAITYLQDLQRKSR